MARSPHRRSIQTLFAVNSIRGRLLLPLLLIGTVLGLSVIAIVRHRLIAASDTIIAQEAERLSFQLMISAQTGASEDTIQRLVAATASQRNVKLALVVSGNPFRIQYSSQAALIGKGSHRGCKPANPSFADNQLCRETIPNDHA